MKRKAIILGLILGVTVVASAQQTIVFPAVSDEVEGRNGSLWVTVARFIKVDPRDTVTISRKWVCLPDGGFLQEDPGHVPHWTLPAGSNMRRLVLVWGDEMLGGSDENLGAVAYEVEGGKVVANSYVVDVSRGEHLDMYYYSVGQGQFVRGMEEPLVGASHIPWLGGCMYSPCSADQDTYWDFHRNNIGIVNPNPEPLTVTGTVLPIGGSDGFITVEIDTDDVETFSRSIPPYGWVQFKWESNADYGSDPFGEPIRPLGGFLISLTPDTDAPYYAYASVVFTPDPESEIPVFNDPMFVPAEPGYVAPYSEVYP